MERDIADPAVQKELKEKTGKVLVPTILLDGEVYIGWNEHREMIERQLARAGRG